MPRAITIEPQRLDAILFDLSQTKPGHRGRLLAREAGQLRIARRTLEHYIRRRKKERGLPAHLRPGDVPKPKPKRSNQSTGSNPPTGKPTPGAIPDPMPVSCRQSGARGRFTSDEHKVLSLLDALHRLTLAEIAERSGLSPSRTWHAVHRLLNYKRIMCAMERYCSISRSVRPTFKSCYNL